jgi:hypothetical protein
MDLLFKIGVAWIFVSYYLIYVQTKFYGYLIVATGAALNLCANLFLDKPVVGRAIAVVGTCFFWMGIGALGTFGLTRERERIRLSSWSQIVRGVVPDSLRTPWTTRNQVAHCLIFLVLSMIVTFVAGELKMALIFALLAVIFLAYCLLRVKLRP